MKIILIMAGGTGGHVFPALASAQLLQQAGYQVHWLGAERGLENKVVPEHGLPLHRLRISGWRGKGLLGWLLAPFRLVHALGQAAAIFARVQPDLVLGFGGFASGPGGLMALLKRKPLIIHEQNAKPGFTNLWLNRLGAHALQAFDHSLKGARTIGNPLRNELLEPRASLKSQPGQPLHLLVLGGSLGAKALNEQMPGYLAELARQQPLIIWHQCGEPWLDATRAIYAHQAVDVRVVSFIADMSKAYAWADMVICRAGALTVSEVANQGLPALFIPYPYAVDDHQFYNAQALVQAGGGQLVRQQDLTGPLVLQTLLPWCQQPELRQQMGAAAQAWARPKAGQELLAYCQYVLGDSHGN